MSRAVDGLFRRQLLAWPLLEKGVRSLAQAKTRPVFVDGREMRVRHIPHRVMSSTAKVDAETIRKRPCFLCRENLYPQQEGLPFGPDHTIYCNPFPIVERHLTVVQREHRPQRVEGQVGTMLDLAAALAGAFVIYNGPECGASAPDHMHLQAGERFGLPILNDIARRPGPAIDLFGGRALLLRGNDRSRLTDDIRRTLEILSTVTGRSPEPWCNIAVFHEPATGWTVTVFPRHKHRPAVFHNGELTVSPAAIDLCGILVVPLEKDLARIDGPVVAAVFDEVTLPEDQFREVVAHLERGR